jgi:4a-hydroxytetrahydrobiopterin dehydratase
MKITEKQLQQLFIQNWNVVNDKLQKNFAFKTYQELIHFTNKVFEIAQKQNHHPELLLKYTSVEVFINNHEERNISSKCNNFALAVDLINFSLSI